MASKTLPKQMKVQVLEAYNEPYALKSIPLPVISSDDDLLIKVDAASYCHTDAVLASRTDETEPSHIPTHRQSRVCWDSRGSLRMAFNGGQAVQSRR